MNTACKSVVSAAVLCLLSACASTEPLATLDPGRSVVQDDEYIALVEYRADHAPERVRVIWVNPPEERLAGQ